MFAKLGLDTDEYEKALGNSEGKTSKFATSLKSGFKSIAKASAASITAVATGVGAIAKQSVEAYAEYEQLVGGVETLFGTRGAKTVEEYAAIVGQNAKFVSAEFEMLQKAQTLAMENAASAYKTAGKSANEYMEIVSGFAASLKQSTASELEAAEYANMAVIDMADNANKMGTDMSMIQNAYQGFAKQNYTMLDNLKLGYGGTKEEMARLLKDAEKLSGKKFDLSSYADVVDAIHVIQEEMGIAGATAAEASTTIEGSLNSMKAAWKNVLVGIADDEADFDTLIKNLVTSIVGDGTQGNGGVLGNLIPRVETALQGVASLISKLFPAIMGKIPEIIESTLPQIVSAAVDIIWALIEGISQNQESLFTVAFDTIQYLALSILSMLPEIIKLGIDLVIGLAQGISENLPELIPAVLAVILYVAEIITNPENLSTLLEAAFAIIREVAYGLMDALPQLVDAAIAIITSLVSFLLEPENITLLLSTALEIVLAIGSGLISAVPELIKSVEELILSIVATFKDADWQAVGGNLVEGFKRGIQNAWGNLKKWFTGLFGDLTQIAKDILGIASPSKVFKQFGKYIDEGLALGIEQNSDVPFAAVGKLAEGVGAEFGSGENLILARANRTTGGVSALARNLPDSNENISRTDALLTELINMFANGTAVTKVGNTREMRRIINA